MRSWVIGRLPRAAARWSGVRASRGETQEFTWNIVMSLKQCFFMWSIRKFEDISTGCKPLRVRSVPAQVIPLRCHTWSEGLIFVHDYSTTRILAQTIIQIIGTCKLRQRAPAQVSEALARLSTILSSRTWQGATRGVISWATKLVADRLHCHFFSLTLASITKFVHVCLLGFDKALFLLPGTIWARFL